MSELTKKEIAKLAGLCFLALLGIALTVYMQHKENTFPSAEEARIQTEKAIQKTEKRRQAYCSDKHITFVQRDIIDAIRSGKNGVYADVMNTNPYHSAYGFNCDAEVKNFLQQLEEHKGYSYKAAESDNGPAYYVSWN